MAVCMIRRQTSMCVLVLAVQPQLRMTFVMHFEGNDA
jgi:hypothetical protein